MRGDRHLLGGVFLRVPLGSHELAGGSVSEAWKSMRQVCAVCDIWAYQPLVNHVCAQPKSSGPREFWLVKPYGSPWIATHEHNAKCYAKDGHEVVHVIERTPEVAAAHEAIALLKRLRNNLDMASREVNTRRLKERCDSAVADADRLLAKIAAEREGLP